VDLKLPKPELAAQSELIESFEAELVAAVARDLSL